MPRDQILLPLVIACLADVLGLFDPLLLARVENGPGTPIILYTTS